MRSSEPYKKHCGTCGQPVITDGTMHVWSGRMGLPEKPYDHEPTPEVAPDSSTTYRVSFDRIGRNHNAPDLVATVDGPNHLADLIHQHARPHLRSADVAVVFEDDMLSGWIFCGFRAGGTFTIAEQVAVATRPSLSEGGADRG